MKGFLLASILPCLAFEFFAKPKRNPFLANLDNLKEGVVKNAKKYEIPYKGSQWDPDGVKDFLYDGQFEERFRGFGDVVKGYSDSIKDKLDDVYVNVKGNMPLPDQSFSPTAPPPRNWKTDRLRLYLLVRGVDPSHYTNEEMVGIATLILGNVEASGRFEIILDSWPEFRLESMAGDVKTNSRFKLVESAAMKFNETVEKMHKDERLREQYVHKTIESTKDKVLDNFNDWSEYDLAMYLDSYGAQYAGYSIVEVAKDNYYHFVHGFHNNRPNFMNSIPKLAIKVVARNLVPLPDLVLPMVGL